MDIVLFEFFTFFLIITLVLGIIIEGFKGAMLLWFASIVGAVLTISVLVDNTLTNALLGGTASLPLGNFYFVPLILTLMNLVLSITKKF